MFNLEYTLHGVYTDLFWLHPIVWLLAPIHFVSRPYDHVLESTQLNVLIKNVHYFDR